MSVGFDQPTGLRRAVGGLVLVGIVSYAGLIALGQPFAAVGVWLITLAGATSLRWRSSVPLFDERDASRSREAARVTLAVVGVASGVVFPSLVVAATVGAFEWTAWSTAIALGVTALYVLYGIALVAVGWRG